MSDFVHNLKSNKILTAQDIIRLRTYIETKYPTLDANKRADILIHSIRNIINGYLKLIPESHHHDIREALLKTKLLSKQEPIALYDIFETFTAMDQNSDNLSNMALDWVNAYLDHPITMEDLHAHFPLQEDTVSAVSKAEYAIDPAIDPVVGPPEVLEENHRLAEENSTFSPAFQSKNTKKSFNPSPIHILFVGLALIAAILFSTNSLQSAPIKAEESTVIAESEILEPQHPHLPDYFRYKQIDTARLKAYLKSRDSLLEEDPYFSAIIHTAKDFDLNPLILFAIAGHEQGFVPKSNPLAKEIANNPFNVFFSWQDYNTDIIDSSQIAARTVINLSKERPEDVDPFQWINRKYAEDQEWWKGVKSIYNRLEREVQNLSSDKI